MSTTSKRHSLPLRARSRDARTASAHSAPRRPTHSQTVSHWPSRVASVMGPPNHAPGMPVMGAASPGLHLNVMGGPDTGTRLNVMGGPDAGPHLNLMGKSDPSFVDSLFTERKSLL